MRLPCKSQQARHEDLEVEHRTPLQQMSYRGRCSGCKGEVKEGASPLNSDWMHE